MGQVDIRLALHPRAESGASSPVATPAVSKSVVSGQKGPSPPSRKGPQLILRIDRIAAELPPPSEPDPAGAAAVQELLGGKFGEMSTLMNYTMQSFNFRNRSVARPFYDLVTNIAAEEFGHIELVAMTINNMLTGATPDGEKAPSAALAGVKGVGQPAHFLAGGQGALLQDARGLPWTGDNVFS